MIETQYDLISVIEFLNKLENKDRIFSRVNDNSFKIKKGFLGDLVRELPKQNIIPLPIFLHTQDLWILEEEN